MGISKKICICKEYLRLEAKCNVISTRNNNTMCPCHTIEEVLFEGTETTRTTVGLRCACVFLLMRIAEITSILPIHVSESPSDYSISSPASAAAAFALAAVAVSHSAASDSFLS